MDILTALNTLITLTTTINIMTAQALKISQIVQKAQSEGRKDLTSEEWSVILAADDSSRQALLAAITKALGNGGASK